ncbi:uncharacterized protein MYCFIDRAFT_44875 [Pseudocercospora fijiensis CIRAD86]|uniref:FAD-binding domain-containing protein n=1 Tax=Pseudocercospora fijiensis (strain CIRAD86) TaxID=383855 RepID=M2YIQ9_PSEFD|nr:uncharacterized protein MYCFIDRAFT_44875 [Pseudocercospora fijiensis CIRAD86]EME77650.1 hypothetical protein MYCFIDRAFT_44875 [Pseudocercospora fijiensis CIRAD86]
MTSCTKLNIAIIGSGLAGLTAARVLREQHNVTVYERGDANTATGGQGIILASNGVNMLTLLSYNASKAGAVPVQGLTTYSKDGTLLKDVGMDLEPRYGADCQAMKRSDFRDELYRLATAPSVEIGIGGDPARVVLNTPVVGLDPEKGIIELHDGTKVSADAVIIADGVHSRLRSTIIQDPSLTAKKTGLTCYRIAVPISSVPTPHPRWTSHCNRSSIFYAGDDTPRVITAYPIRNATMFNLSCILRTEVSTKATTESWHVDGDREKMLEAFQDFDPMVVKVLKAATDVKVWELQDLEPLSTWTRGRAILIGDAAHAMTPMQGQGANMAIEDAEAFRLLNAPGVTSEDVPEIFNTMDGVRRPRVARVLAETRKSHSTTGVAERVVQNMDFIYGYKGIHHALAGINP